MLLNEKLKNSKCIGKKVTAHTGTNKDWAEYSDSNEGEKNYYRDVYDVGTVIIIYMYGETCTIEGFNESEETVLLSNEDCVIECFEIPYNQYKEDFGVKW